MRVASNSRARVATGNDERNDEQRVARARRSAADKHTSVHIAYALEYQEEARHSHAAACVLSMHLMRMQTIASVTPPRASYLARHRLDCTHSRGRHQRTLARILELHSLPLLAASRSCVRALLRVCAPLSAYASERPVRWRRTRVHTTPPSA
jgi:hypothetical protein